MRSIRPSSHGRRDGRTRHRNSPVLTAVLLSSVLALTSTACGPGSDTTDGAAPSTATAWDDKIRIPEDIADRLGDYGIDIDKWRNGDWKSWDKDDWLREANDYVNPIIEDLWDPDRMRYAEQPGPEIDENEISGARGVTDATPVPVRAQAVPPSYHANAPTAGKVFFDSPEGTMVCSATVVRDPANPGRSNMVWTAGHCVHAGRSGGWYRNIAFVPSYNDTGRPAGSLGGAAQDEVAPYGVWWGDWAQTSDQWIERGGATGGAGASYDFAVVHVTSALGGDGKSLEETVGSALPVDFQAPAAPDLESVTATGYPAGAPYDGQALFRCEDQPGRLSLSAADPAMYRIGCSMTSGSSGGGWVAEGSDGQPTLVSNTSIGPVTSGWLAGPRLGDEAKSVYDAVSSRFAGR